ncbi:SDR family oxidoreductase, partial [Rhizobiaceae sp. 2RAB30]
ACVVLADIDEAALERAVAELGKTAGSDFVRAAKVDVTDEAAVVAGFAQTAVQFGGVDILISNAGLASSAPIEETTLALWNKNMDILSTGYFLVSREAFKLFRAQGI